MLQGYNPWKIGIIFRLIQRCYDRLILINWWKSGALEIEKLGFVNRAMLQSVLIPLCYDKVTLYDQAPVRAN